MSEHCYIRAEVIGSLPSGQKRVRLLATNADGITFYTDEASLLPAYVIEKETIKAPERIERPGGSGDRTPVCPTCKPNEREYLPAPAPRARRPKTNKGGEAMKKRTIKDKLADAVKAFRGKPKTTLTFGVSVQRCNECERVKTRHAEWVRGFYLTDANVMLFHCSACEHCCWHGGGQAPIWDYCPNCGAKMGTEAET